MFSGPDNPFGGVYAFLIVVGILIGVLLVLTGTLAL